MRTGGRVGRLVLRVAGTALGAAIAAQGLDLIHDSSHGGGSGIVRAADLTTVVRGDGYSVRMPGAAKRTVQQVPTAAGVLAAKIDMYRHGRYAYAASVATAPRGAGVDLDGAVQGSAAALRGRVVSSRPATVAGLPARDAQIESTRDGNRFTTFARVVAVDRSLVELQYIVTGHGISAPPAEFDAFVATLELG